MEAMVISCDGCVVGPGDRCRDCLVTFLCDDGPVVLDAATANAVHLLQRAHLVPLLRRTVIA